MNKRLVFECLTFGAMVVFSAMIEPAEGSLFSRRGGGGNYGCGGGGGCGGGHRHRRCHANCGGCSGQASGCHASSGACDGSGSYQAGYRGVDGQAGTPNAASTPMPGSTSQPTLENPSPSDQPTNQPRNRDAVNPNPQQDNSAAPALPAAPRTLAPAPGPQPAPTP